MYEQQRMDPFRYLQGKMELNNTLYNNKYSLVSLLRLKGKGSESILILMQYSCYLCSNVVEDLDFFQINWLHWYNLFQSNPLLINERFSTFCCYRKTCYIGCLTTSQVTLEVRSSCREPNTREYLRAPSLRKVLRKDLCFLLRTSQ